MSDNKKIVYFEPKDYFFEGIREKCKIGDYAEEETLEDCAGIQPIPMIENPDKTNRNPKKPKSKDESVAER